MWATLGRGGGSPASGGGRGQARAGPRQGPAQLLGVAPDLGEQEAALDGGYGDVGQRLDRRVGAELSPLTHALEALPQRALPALEAARERDARGLVALGQ